jgi:hypothetical protein
MSQCARPACIKMGKSFCSVCEKDKYCGSECQKLDWKVHKLICPILKQFSKKVNPCVEVMSEICEIMSSTKRKDSRVIEHLLSFAENQFGKKVAGKAYPEREDGDHYSEWPADIILHKINARLVDICNENNLISKTTRNEKMFPYLEKSICLLSPWLGKLESDISDGIGSDSVKNMEFLLEELQFSEHAMFSIAVYKNQFDEAEGHCQRCLTYSKRLGASGETKTTCMFKAICAFSWLRRRQGDYSAAVIFAEEAYNLVVEAYDPVHPQVQVHILFVFY